MPAKFPVLPLPPVLLLFCLGAGLSLGACRPHAESEKPLVVDVIGENTEQAVIADSVSAGLTAIDSAGNVIPGIAQSWRISNDGLAVVFRLRKAHYADGSDISASDAVAAIEAARKGQAGEGLASLLQGIRNVSTPLEDVVELQLSTPQPELLELLSMPALGIVHRPRGKGHSKGQGKAQTIRRAGPFSAETLPGTDPSTTSLRPRANAAATVEQAPPAIQLQRRTSADSIHRFNRGESDLVLGGRLPGLADARVTARRGALLVERPRSVLLLLVNQHHPQLRNHAIRHALQLAINREELSRSLYGTQAATPVSALSPGNIRGYEPPEPDWATSSFASRQLEASRLLQPAAEDQHDTNPDDPDPATMERLQFTVAISTDPADTEIMTAIAQDLAAIGVELKLARRSAKSHLQAVQKGEFELALVRHDTPTDSPLPFLLPFLCDANALAICVPDADHMIAESWRAESFPERLAFLRTAEWLWTREAVAISLLQPVRWALVSPRITGIAANRSGRHPLNHIQLTENRKLIP